MTDAFCTIIIPAYNAEKTIAAAIDSIFDGETQEGALKVIVVDDGSSDRTYETVMARAEKRREIICIKKKNEGPSSARNEGIRLADTPYLGFLDADDRMNRWGFDIMMSQALERNADMAIGSYDRCADGKEPFRTDCVLSAERLYNREEIEQIVLRRYFNGKNKGLPNVWNKLYRTDIVRSAGLKFDEKMTHGEDWKFNIDFLEAASTVWVTDVPVVEYNAPAVNYQKYKRGLAYSLNNEFRVAQRLNREYGFAGENDEDYLLFIGRAAEKSLALLRMKSFEKKAKKQFVSSAEQQELYRFLSGLNMSRLLFLGYSRKDKAGFWLIKNKMIDAGIKIIDG